MTVEFLASLHDAKRLRTLLADGKRPACGKSYVSLASDHALHHGMEHQHHV